MDEMLPDAMLNALQYTLNVLGALILISAVLPFFSLAVIPVAAVSKARSEEELEQKVSRDEECKRKRMFATSRRRRENHELTSSFLLFSFSKMYIFLSYFYRFSSREIKRLEGVTRSPIIAHLSATLQGLQSIRAFGVGDKYVEKKHERRRGREAVFFHFLFCSSYSPQFLSFSLFFFVLPSSLLTPSSLLLYLLSSSSSSFPDSLRITSETQTSTLDAGLRSRCLRVGSPFVSMHPLQSLSGSLPFTVCNKKKTI